MKKLFYLSLCLCAFLACKKDYDKIDKQKIDDYLSSKGITAQSTSSGLRYAIDEQGTGQIPTIADQVKVKYKASLLDGTVVDKTDSAVWIPLWQAITGWQEGLQFFQKGGKGRLFLPSSQAYGAQILPTIPQHSPMVFDIELADVRSEKQQIDTYIKIKGLNAKSTFTGLYYVVEDPGTGTDFPTLSSTVTVKYKGYTFDGTIFDSNDEYVTKLTGVIKGWQEGIPLFKKGSKGKLIIPSSLAYGASGSGRINPFTPIVFDIEVLNF